MSSKPSQQSLQVHAQIVVRADESDQTLHSSLRAALAESDRFHEYYKMDRHDPENETNARRILLDRLRSESDSPTATQPDFSHLGANEANGGLHIDLAADDYLSKHEQAAENGLIKNFRAFGEFMVAELMDGRILVQQSNLILESPIEPMLVCLDETQYWKDDAPEVKAAGRIFATYLIDTSVVTNLCEITPSFELRHLATTPENDDEDSRIHEWIQAHDNPASENDTYRHVRSIERLSDSKKLVMERRYMEADETYEQTIERIIEDYRCSPQLEVPCERSTTPSLG